MRNSSNLVQDLPLELRSDGALNWRKGLMYILGCWFTINFCTVHLHLFKMLRSGFGGMTVYHAIQIYGINSKENQCASVTFRHCALL